MNGSVDNYGWSLTNPILFILLIKLVAQTFYDLRDILVSAPAVPMSRA